MKYSIGLDFGTLSGRAVLAETETGREVSVFSMDYPHAVMDRQLPDGTPLGIDWALQHPQDWLDVLSAIVPGVLREAGVSPSDVAGVGVDFTTCTWMPCLADGTPLCFLSGLEHEPNAWPKLWKHHAAQDKADRVTRLAQERGEEFLTRYGGKVSSEWALPKTWQVLDESPELYERADVFVEAGDWLVWQMTGCLSRNACMAGHKALWHKGNGYPSREFLRSLDPRLENFAEEKLRGDVVPVGQKAGGISEKGAALTGLLPGTPVAVSTADAHVLFCATGVTEPGRMVAIIGTSSVYLLLGNEEKNVPGMCGVVEDGIIPGFFGFEEGQCCCGDHFSWFVQNCIPGKYEREAEAAGISVFKLLQHKASGLRPGESGLIALDWWNGNRSVLVDADLTGMILGLSLRTTPEEIYRALLEATAYGARVITESFRSAGLNISELVVSGGITLKDPMMMQIYADVLRMPVRVLASKQGPALGAAVFGAAVAGSARGGYDTLAEASRAMCSPTAAVYEPDAGSADVYDRLYAEYLQLHDYFGRGGNDVMKRLKAIRRLG